LKVSLFAVPAVDGTWSPAFFFAISPPDSYPSRD
jgi:hypothetical protein